MTEHFALFAGTANPALAATIARELAVGLGDCAVERFPDGELTVRLLMPVRGKEAFLIQPTAPPVNDHLMELLAFAEACRRAASRWQPGTLSGSALTSLCCTSSA